MTTPELSARGIDAPVDVYEKLRSQVLAGSPRSGQLGLGLLLREGVCALVDRCAAFTAPAAPSAAVSHVGEPKVVFQEIHKSFARVLAGIALSGREEMT